MTSLTTLVGDDLGGGYSKWRDSVYCNANKHVYGIPLIADRILKFNPADKSSTRIGPDLGNGCKYRGGTEDEKGCIYCTPKYWSDRGMLKIDTNSDTVTILDARPPEQNRYSNWTKGVLGLDGNIYFMPINARRILKLNTDTDTFESIGDDLGGGWRKYCGAVRGIDGCIYGIPRDSNRIMKYDPVSQVTSYIGKKHSEDFKCCSNGTLARDGCIYAFSIQCEVLKINTTPDNNNGNDTFSWAWVGKRVNTKHTSDDAWGDAIAGIDGCIYWPPMRVNRTLKHDPHTDHTSLVGNDVGDDVQWYSGALATDGVIYCMPYHAPQVLAIDPFRGLTETLEADTQQYPEEEFGRLFELGEGGITKFESAIVKFGQKGFQLIVDRLPLANEAFPTNQQLYPFMVAASLPNGALSIIYHLVRQAPELMRRH